MICKQNDKIIESIADSYKNLFYDLKKNIWPYTDKVTFIILELRI
jgi:hypothetical protein